jgi:YidC/Oxa1 family membrane protein insertase
MMKFYKENQINPLGGCLPLLAQMPVFIALYQTLRDIQHFIPDTSDMYAAICSPKGGNPCGIVSLDFFGLNLTQSASSATGGFMDKLPYFVLAGLVVVTAFFQQRQTMRNQVNVNPQMQVIGKIMPLIFGMFAISMPAGVVLYFLTSNLWQIGQQEVVFRTIGTAAGPPAKKAAAAGGGGGAVTAKSTDVTAPPPSGGVKGLFKSLSPATAADGAADAPGKAPPKNGSGAKPSGAKPAASAKPATGKTGAGKPSGDATKSKGNATSANARRKNNRKRKR